MRILRQSIVMLICLTSVLCVDLEAAVATTQLIKVDKKVKHFKLRAHYKQPSTFTFTSQVLRKIEPNDWPARVVLESTADVVTVYVEEGLQANEIIGQFTVNTRLYTLVVTVVVAESAQKAAAAILVEHQALLEVLTAAAKQIAQFEINSEKRKMDEEQRKRDADHAVELARVRAEAQATRRESGEAMLLTELDERVEATRLRGSSSCEGTDIVICGQEWTPLRGSGVLRFVVSNRSAAQVDFTRAEVHSAHGEADHAGLIRVDEAEPVSSKTLRASLAPGQSAVMSVLVRNPKGLGGRVKLALGVAGRSFPAVKTIYLDPEPKEGEGLITLSLQGIAGAVWLANPVDPGTLGATSAAGAELRVRYGFNPRWSFEGALAGARSGTASWDGMTYNNQEGMLVRDATVGRVLFGGLLHFGDTFRPLARAGLGFQGVSHGSQFTPSGGAEQAGPDVSFELGLLWYAGLGLEARLNPSWSVGFNVTGVGVATSTNSLAGLKTSFEGGLHLSYGWTPGY